MTDEPRGAPRPDDPAARALLQTATERNYRWPPGFGGFAAALRYRDDQRALAGRVHAPSPRALRVELPEADAPTAAWIQTELASLIGHRLHRPFAQGDGRYGVTAAPDDGHPFGQRVELHGDPLRSSYRIRDGVLRQASRVVGERCFTLSVHALQPLGPEQSLACHYSVAHFDGASGRLIRSDVYQDHYVKLDGVWLPALRQVLTADDSGLLVRVLELSEHRLLAAQPDTLAPEEYDRLRAKR